MKKFALAASAAAMMVAAPAFAQTSGNPVLDTFDVTANVALTCAMEDVGPIDLGTLTLNMNAGSGALVIAPSQQQDNADFWLTCNSTNNLRVKSINGGYLQGNNAATDADAGFTDQIFYGVRVNNYHDTAAVGTRGTYSEDISPPRPAIHRQINLTAIVEEILNPDRPIAGTYTDTVEIEVTAV